MAAETVPALTNEQRAQIESGLVRAVLGSVYVNNLAKLTVEIRLPESVTEDDSHALEREVERAMQQLAQAVDRVLPEKVST